MWFRHTAVYEEFCTLFEDKIEQIIAETRPNATGEDLARALKGLGDDASFTVELLLSVTDYNNFVGMMQHYKADAKRKAEEWNTGYMIEEQSVYTTIN